MRFYHRWSFADRCRNLLLMCRNDVSIGVRGVNQPQSLGWLGRLIIVVLSAPDQRPERDPSSAASASGTPGSPESLVFRQGLESMRYNL